MHRNLFAWCGGDCWCLVMQEGRQNISPRLIEQRPEAFPVWKFWGDADSPRTPEGPRQPWKQKLLDVFNAFSLWCWWSVDPRPSWSPHLLHPSGVQWEAAFAPEDASWGNAQGRACLKSLWPSWGDRNSADVKATFSSWRLSWKPLQLRNSPGPRRARYGGGKVDG